VDAVAENNNHIHIDVLADYVAKRLVITFVNGGIDVREEDFPLQAGDTIQVTSSTPSSIDGQTNLTLADGSVLSDVPMSKIGHAVANNNSGKGCGGCGKSRQNRS